MTPKYRADIDGLRAGSSLFSGGYVGVDIFFVISGYLITTIIVREIANNDFSIDLGKSAIATTLFSSNILFYFESGYFDSPAELKPLLYTCVLHQFN